MFKCEHMRNSTIYRLYAHDRIDWSSLQQWLAKLILRLEILNFEKKKKSNFDPKYMKIL